MSQRNFRHEPGAGKRSRDHGPLYIPITSEGKGAPTFPAEELCYGTHRDYMIPCAK